MLDRRQFIEIGMLMVAAGWTSSLAQILPVPHDALTPSVIVDERIPVSRMFARRARVVGWRTLDLRSDVADLWYTVLRPELTSAPYPLIGVTLESDFFVLKQLTAELGMSLACETRHEGSHGFASWIIVPRRTIACREAEIAPHDGRDGRDVERRYSGATA